MNASQLRIGNIVRFTNEEGSAPIECTADDIKLCVHYPNCFSGIPITGGYLRRLGFKKNKDTGAFLLKVKNEIKMTFNLADGSGSVNGKFNTVKYYFVHEAQNLYYALSGGKETYKHDSVEVELIYDPAI